MTNAASATPTAAVGGPTKDGLGFWIDLSGAAYRRSQAVVAFVAMVDNTAAGTEIAGELAFNVVYLERCPSCEDGHEYHVRVEEWTGVTSVKKYLKGALRDCPYTGDPLDLIVVSRRDRNDGQRYMRWRNGRSNADRNT